MNFIILTLGYLYLHLMIKANILLRRGGGTDTIFFLYDVFLWYKKKALRKFADYALSFLVLSCKTLETATKKIRSKELFLQQIIDKIKFCVIIILCDGDFFSLIRKYFIKNNSQIKKKLSVGTRWHARVAIFYEGFDAIQVLDSSSLSCKRGRLHEFMSVALWSCVGVCVRVYELILGDRDVLRKSALLLIMVCCELAWFRCWIDEFTLGFLSALFCLSCCDGDSIDEFVLCADADRFNIELLFCNDVPRRLLSFFSVKLLLLLLLLLMSIFVANVILVDIESCSKVDDAFVGTAWEYCLIGDTDSILLAVLCVLLLDVIDDCGTASVLLLVLANCACAIRCACDDCCCCWSCCCCWDNNNADWCAVWLLLIDENPFACDVSHIEGVCVLLVGVLSNKK